MATTDLFTIGQLSRTPPPGALLIGFEIGQRATLPLACRLGEALAGVNHWLTNVVPYSYGLDLKIRPRAAELPFLEAVLFERAVVIPVQPPISNCSEGLSQLEKR